MVDDKLTKELKLISKLRPDQIALALALENRRLDAEKNKKRLQWPLFLAPIVSMLHLLKDWLMQ